MKDCQCSGVAVYGEVDRICMKCKGHVPLDERCESCGGERSLPTENLCATCASLYALQANALARRKLGCGEGHCEHELPESSEN